MILDGSLYLKSLWIFFFLLKGKRIKCVRCYRWHGHLSMTGKAHRGLSTITTSNYFISMSYDIIFHIVHTLTLSAIALHWLCMIWVLVCCGSFFVLYTNQCLWIFAVTVQCKQRGRPHGEWTGCCVCAPPMIQPAGLHMPLILPPRQIRGPTKLTSPSRLGTEYIDGESGKRYLGTQCKKGLLSCPCCICVLRLIHEQPCRVETHLFNRARANEACRA